MKILLAGGAGYIGSHIALALLENGQDVVVMDNFDNSSPEAIMRVEEMTGQTVSLYEADVTNKKVTLAVFKKEKPDCVIHLAGLKAVGESIEQPIRYYRNNIDTTLTLLECMAKTGCKNIVFSSSATVYGEENAAPCHEKMPKGKCSNPYGWTKSMMEQILQDASVADKDMSVVLLRYFNPIGAHESGRIGENPRGIPNNLMPYVTQVAVGKRDKLTIFGDDYDTPDGTCLRDYIHIMDLAEGHLKAVDFCVENKGTEIINLGTGQPYSVLDIVKTFEKVNNIQVPYEIGPRRGGDLPAVYADVSKAEKVLGWKAKRTLADMCRDSWNWQKNNPEGYE
ncbi:MAG: UDP-glucose 4-epimerase GalE [Anaerovibrio sp.]|uniref:UDP-glucose 4-epimerase GalE n=1 Tax=uncultured Anaerovibrio sp. TaxID=361586 RepID=UPI0025EDE827|nr:UDP-glucose 4-epimerase GalE [uncultured Anaerovibrio sp.]MBQ3853429.1 UDP-glucose 4-epimerase GalE [Anaerovibrio sp.]